MLLAQGSATIKKSQRMELPPIDLSWFAEELSETVQHILDVWNDAGNSVVVPDNVSPKLLTESLQQLIEVLRTQDWNDNPSRGESALAGVDISELGDYGLHMLADLSQLCADLELEQEIERLEQLALCLGLWVVRQQGVLRSVELVVNGIARLANRSQDQVELECLFHIMGEILDAVSLSNSAEYTLEAPMNNPLHLLLLNRAIVATRTLLPELMETAFAEVADQLPEVAPGFFSEGMEQIKIQGYPAEVREVIERYYLEYPQASTIH